VLVFDGTNEDRAAKRIVFTDNVQMLTGLEVGLDGVWLMCPPQLIFIPDRNHDDVPDSDGEVVLDGFTVAEQNYHNFANGLRFGPDGWLYGRCGGSCPGRIGLPGTPDSERLAMEGGMWRYHPKQQLVEVLTTGTTNPWGHDWNNVGEAFFVNTVNGHLWHMIPGAHFTRPFTLDPNRLTYELIDFHADHWHFDTGQSWMDSRDGAANAYGGGHAHSGTMIYQGDNWPAEYRGKLFTLNFHGRRANQENLVRQGSGYVGKHDPDFMFATDTWFRGMELASGPDGSVFVLDWSDAGECHEHTGVHRTSGRIFKVQYGQQSSQTDQLFDLMKWTPSQLAEAHRSPNDWHIRQARLEINRRHQRGDDLTEAVTQLGEMFADTTADSQIRVQSLLTLHSAGALSEARLIQLLGHGDEHVRAWSIRLLTEGWLLDDAMGPVTMSESKQELIRQQATSILPSLVSTARDDDSALVRLTLASTLQRLPIELRPQLAVELVKHAEDAEDHNLPLMLWYGVMATTDRLPSAMISVLAECRLPTTSRLISRCLAEKIEREPAVIRDALRLAIDRPELRQPILSGVSEGLNGWRRAPKPENWDQVVAIRTEETDSTIRELSVVFGDGRALADLKKIVSGDIDADPDARLAALDALIQSRPEDLRSI
jgi:putative membrane-bound dehydrogenase-like protein